MVARHVMSGRGAPGRTARSRAKLAAGLALAAGYSHAFIVAGLADAAAVPAVRLAPGTRVRAVRLFCVSWIAEACTNRYHGQTDCFEYVLASRWAARAGGTVGW